MPDPISWYALGRDVGDPQTILEAVDEKILEHNLDPSAHGQSDEAVYMHRISSLLDHVNYSIYNIKLHPETRPIKAFVDIGGAAEFTKVQDAIDYVHALGGGKIFIKAGTYNQTDNITLYSDIELEGEDDDTTIVDFGYLAKYMIAEGTSGFHVKNVRISHMGFTKSASNSHCALSFVYADDCEVKHCKFYDNADNNGDGAGDIEISNGLRIYITENRFSSLANIRLEGNSIYIDHNYFDGAPKAGVEGNCIYMEHTCSSIKIIDNHFDATIQSAIYIQNNYGASSQILVANNFFAGADTWEIYADPVESMTIIGNVFDNSGIGGSVAISLQGCNQVTISGNVITSFSYNGIDLNASDHTSIVGNVIANCDSYGINISTASCDGTVVVGNSMSGNSSGNVHDLGTGSIVQHNG